MRSPKAHTTKTLARRAASLMSLFVLGACSLLVRNVGVERCDNEGEVVCREENGRFVQVECVNGIEQATNCGDLPCQDGFGCQGTCGNNVLEINEECDGTDIAEANCAQLPGANFDAGVVACNIDCTLDLSGCSLCGDGLISGNEECDGADVPGCNELGSFNRGRVVCNADCTVDASDCSDCGNGTAEASEQCDSNGFECLGDCTFFIPPFCMLDNNQIPPEVCSGTDLRGQDCTDFGFDGGVLVCNNQCTFDSGGCTQ